MAVAAGRRFGPERSKSVLLVNPWIHDFAAYDYWAQPLGLLYLAALLRAGGINTDLINCLDPFHPGMEGTARPARSESGRGKFFQEEIPKPAALAGIPRKYKRYGIRPAVFRRELRRRKAPGLVLVTSMMTYWYPGVSEAVELVREAWPHVPIFLGGNYARLCFDHAVRQSGADAVITADARESLPEIFDALGVKPVPGDGPDGAGESLDSLPYPAFDLLTSPAQVPVLTSRGCPFRCTYCASPVLNKGFIRRDPARVADEIEFWRLKGIRNFSIYDDAFLVRPAEMAVPLMREIIDRKLDCRFHCPNGLHLREINEETAALMRQSGFATLRFGFETSDPRRQADTGGKVRGEDLLSAVRHLRRAGYQANDIGVYLLCGLPGQQAGEIADSIEFVKSGGARPILAEFSPIPGTAVWEECRRSSRFDLGEPLFHNNTLLPCAGPGLPESSYRVLKQMCRVE
jgi:pyruvate-formate lyase-activating enzyme